eukprot:1043361-Rhodomonas_salina.3
MVPADLDGSASPVGAAEAHDRVGVCGLGGVHHLHRDWLSTCFRRDVEDGSGPREVLGQVPVLGSEPERGLLVCKSVFDGFEVNVTLIPHNLVHVRD